MAGAWTEERRAAASERQRRIWQERRSAAGVPDALICEACGSSYVAPRSQSYDHRRGRRFCSMECRNRAMRDGQVFPRGQEHHAWKGNEAKPLSIRARARQARLRSGVDWCQRCGFMLATETHHRDGNPLNDDEANYEFLCATCHDQEHAADRP